MEPRVGRGDAGGGSTARGRWGGPAQIEADPSEIALSFLGDRNPAVPKRASGRGAAAAAGGGSKKPEWVDATKRPKPDPLPASNASFDTRSFYGSGQIQIRNRSDPARASGETVGGSGSYGGRRPGSEGSDIRRAARERRYRAEGGNCDNTGISDGDDTRPSRDALETRWPRGHDGAGGNKGAGTDLQVPCCGGGASGTSRSGSGSMSCRAVSAICAAPGGWAVAAAGDAGVRVLRVVHEVGRPIGIYFTYNLSVPFDSCMSEAYSYTSYPSPFYPFTLLPFHPS